jgi:hypothetical protein
VSESPKRTARIAGWVYLLNFAFGPALFALKKYVVLKDPAATAANITAHKDLFELGFAGHVVATASYVVVTALFYVLFKPVNKTVSLIAAFFSVVACAVLAVASLFYLTPIAMQGIDPALGLIFLKQYSYCYTISLIFFGFYCASIGYLAYRSTFLPRFIGVGMMAAGLGGLINLMPSFARSLYPFGMVGSIGEVILVVWLILFGVNVQKWNALNT